MANPTSAFGWQMPTSTDLVTDLPADFEVFGQAVDTSLADLKGGTTGQILSKASNTDMDFTWITNDVGDITAVTAGTGISGGGTSGDVTITNSMATAIDAKGDLIAGTGADAFSRLAVGANNTVLTADSSTATGLKWATSSAGGTFGAWTPTWTGVTVGNGTVTAQYAEVGSLVFGYIKLEWGSTTSQSGDAVFSLPVTAVYPTLMTWGIGRQYKPGQVQVILVGSMSSTTTMEIRYQLQATTPDRIRDNSINAGSPYTMTTGDSFSLNFWYRKA